MNALILNGSPRQGGNTAYVCQVAGELLAKKYPGISIISHRLQAMSVAPCRGCNGCKANGGTCLVEDDGKRIAEESAQADILVFATPVYQSGVTAQLKLAMDRMYAKGGLPRKKQQSAYVIAIGADPLDRDQYALIRRQFASLSPYQNWDFRGYCTFCAAGKDELKKQEGVTKTLAQLLEA